jgi:hypothetical protein
VGKVASSEWIKILDPEGFRCRRVDLPVALSDLEFEAPRSPRLWEALKRAEISSALRGRKLRLMRTELDRLRPEMPEPVWQQLSEALGGFGDDG